MDPTPSKNSRLLYCKLALIAFVLTLLYLIVSGNPVNNDSLLAWPISVKLNQPDLYNGDLVVAAGEKTNFLLYKILGKSKLLNENLALRDSILCFGTLFLAIFAWSFFISLYTKNFVLIIACMCAFIFSDYKLGLHWSNVPIPFFVSYSSVYFLQVIALTFFLRKRSTASFFLLGISSFFHPATALCYTAVLSTVKISKTSIKELKFPLLVFSFLFVINYFFFIRAGNSVNFGSEHMEIYKNFQYHAYVRDHFYEGYPFYFLILLALYLMQNNLPSEFRVFFKKFTFISLVFCFGWLINLYFLEIKSVLYLYFPMRIFYLLKPMTIFALVLACYTWLQNAEKDVFGDKFYLVPLLMCLALVSTVFNGSPTSSALVVFSFIIFLIGFKKVSIITMTLAFVFGDQIHANFVRLGEVGYLITILLLVATYGLAKRVKNQSQNGEAWLI